MIRVTLAPTFDAWRTEARRLLAADVPPDEVLWEDATAGQKALFRDDAPEARAAHADGARGQARVPAAFVDLARLVSFHRDAERWSLLYRALHRLTNGEPHLLEVTVDPLTSRLRAMRQAVKREEHAMHAFVRFRRIEKDGVEHFVAWHRPEHPVLRLAAPFFARRFPSMRWAILTPEESAFFDLTELTYGAGAPREAAPDGDALEEMFRTYYRSIFNPARVNLRAMRAEMPERHWATMPEMSVLTELVKVAPARVSAMQAPRGSASEAFVPASRALPVLRDAARACSACDLCARATQTVFGEGSPGAPLMLVGEQPGDLEDRAGRPFVGPAGQLLDRTLAKVGIPRDQLYVTNAVKHFKWEPRGQRRLHAKPSHEESVACFAWLEAEIEAVRPKMILCLGSTAARAFLGRKFSVTQARGQVFATRWAPWWMATLHPAALLRAPDPASRTAAEQRFEEDLAFAASEQRRLSA